MHPPHPLIQKQNKTKKLGVKKECTAAHETAFPALAGFCHSWTPCPGAGSCVLLRGPSIARPRRCMDTRYLYANTPSWVKTGWFSSPWRLCLGHRLSLSHQEDAHLRGKEPESIQDLENLHVGDLGPGLWLNSSNGHSKARKDKAHPGIRHTPECRGHSQRESMLRPHGTKRKHEGKSRASRFLGRLSTTCRGALSRPEIKRSVKKSHPVGVLSLLRRHTHQSLLMSSCGKSSRQYTRSQRKRMKYIMSGCCTNWVSESLCRPPLSRSMASPEWVAFLQKEDTGEEVTSRSPV